MSEQVYKDMVNIMGQRGLGFAGKDIPEFYPLVEELFTPEEAAINNAMPQTTFTAAQMAEIMGTTEAEIAPKLKKMADRCLTQSYMKGDLRLFRAMPFVPGILEFVFIPGGETERDKKLAKLIYAYKEACTAESPMVVPFPMQRVITVDETVETGNQIHTYDQVKTYIEKNDKISVGTCYCRHAAHLRGEDTHGMPMQACLFFGRMADYSAESLDAKKITKKEAYDILDECSAAGLVHQTSNVTDEIGYLCACDKWHCYSIKIFLQQAIPSAVFNSGFEPKFDPDKCTACGTCIDRCPAIALEMGDEDVPVVDLNRCFGCAVCATGCDDDTITMVTKPGYATPPKDNNELMTSMFEAFSAQAK
jgi:Pyruvate/2-oxoacid:ferredoxin oxidoreductase delta subunit